MKRLFLCAFALILLVPAAMAREACTLIVSAETGEEVHRSGTLCAEPYSPASTFVAGLVARDGFLAETDALMASVSR